MATKRAPKKPSNTDELQPPTETREQKLARLATKRVNAATNKIRLIGNLAAYKPTDEQVDKICITLATMCERVEARLRGTRRDDASFTL